MNHLVAQRSEAWAHLFLKGAKHIGAHRAKALLRRHVRKERRKEGGRMLNIPHGLARGTRMGEASERHAEASTHASPLAEQRVVERAVRGLERNARHDVVTADPMQLAIVVVLATVPVPIQNTVRQRNGQRRVELHGVKGSGCFEVKDLGVLGGIRYLHDREGNLETSEPKDLVPLASKRSRFIREDAKEFGRCLHGVLRPQCWQRSVHHRGLRHHRAIPGPVVCGLQRALHFYEMRRRDGLTRTLMMTESKRHSKDVNDGCE